MGKFTKIKILEWKLGWNVKLEITDAQLGIFWGRTSFLVQKHFDKHFMHDIQKKAPQGKILFFLQDILKTAFQVRI